MKTDMNMKTATARQRAKTGLRRLDLKTIFDGPIFMKLTERKIKKTAIPHDTRRTKQQILKVT